MATEKEADEVLDPIVAAERLAPVAYSVSSTAGFAMRAIAHDGTHGTPLRSVMTDFAGALEEWPAFCRELFGRIYDPAGCRRLDDGAATWAIGAANAAEQQEAWSDLCAAASCSRSIAARATETVARAVAATLGLEKNKQTEEKGDPREQRRVANEAAAAAETEEEAAAIREAADEALALAEGERKRLDVRFQKLRHQMRNVVKDAAKAAAEEAELLRALLPLGFSLEGPSSLERVAPDLVAKLKANPKIARIILQAGRMYDAARGAKSIAEGNVDVVGITPTASIARTTSAFKARFTSPGLIGDMALLEIMDGGAQGYEMRDERPREKGDIVYLSDRSGSMEGAQEEAACALGVATMTAAAFARRRCIIGSFAGRGDAKVTLVKPGDVVAAAKALADLCIAADGGTDVEGAIRLAISDVDDLREPDVIVTTDGVFPPVSPSTMKALGDCRLYGVFIGMGEVAARLHPEFHRAWCVDDAAQAAAGVMTEIGARRWP